MTDARLWLASSGLIALCLRTPVFPKMQERVRLPAPLHAHGPSTAP